MFAVLCPSLVSLLVFFYFVIASGSVSPQMLVIFLDGIGAIDIDYFLFDLIFASQFCVTSFLSFLVSQLGLLLFTLVWSLFTWFSITLGWADLVCYNG